MHVSRLTTTSLLLEDSDAMSRSATDDSSNTISLACGYAGVPLIIRAPWLKASVGVHTMAIAELVDLFPTLVDLAGLPQPPASQGLEGSSLLPVLQDPAAAGQKQYAFSQYPRCTGFSMYADPNDYECLTITASNFSHMGFSVRSQTMRYTEWRAWKRSCVGDFSQNGLVAMELYDHKGDLGAGSQTFDNFEYVNLAYDVSQQATVKMLSAVLKKQFDHGGGSGCPVISNIGYSVLED